MNIEIGMVIRVKTSSHMSIRKEAETKVFST